MKEVQRSLAAKGIKPTYQRLKILKYLEATKDHPTADRIYQDLVKDMPTISKTTVYNTLKALADKGIIVPVYITGTEVRYDLCGCNHHHFLCEKCRRIFDLEIICPNLARKEINGNIVKELHGYFKGICAECNKDQRFEKNKTSSGKKGRTPVGRGGTCG